MRADDLKQRVTCAMLLNKLGTKFNPALPKSPMLCPVHKETTPSATYYSTTDSWACHKCGIGGTVIDLAMKTQNMDFKSACKWLQDTFNIFDEQRTPDKPAVFKKVDTYSYKDAYGKPVFYVDRQEEVLGHQKKFIQYRIVDGKQINNVDGITKCLYNLQNLINSPDVFIFEGEKKVKCLIGIDASYPATCNAGGSNGWIASYAETLKEKHVTICPDSDEAGVKWEKAVFESLKDKAKAIRIVKMPQGFNDIADMFDAFGSEGGHAKFLELLSVIPFVERGSDIPIFSTKEMVEIYRKDITSLKPIRLDLGFWLPSLRHHVRPLVPGDVVTIIGDTGTGKTAILENIAAFACKHPTLVFELELSEMMMAERSLAISSNIDAAQIESDTRKGILHDYSKFNHVWTCTLSKIDISQMEALINRAELKIGERPAIVMIDYIGLIGGCSGKRYERLSTIAENIKILAKATKTIIILASQVARKSEDEIEIGLHDAKDSGSVENSSALVLGSWRVDKETMIIKINKNTRGIAGEKITCDYHGSKYLIKERIDNDTTTQYYN